MELFVCVYHVLNFSLYKTLASENILNTKPSELFPLHPQVVTLATGPTDQLFVALERAQKRGGPVLGITRRPQCEVISYAPGVGESECCTTYSTDTHTFSIWCDER